MYVFCLVWLFRRAYKLCSTLFASLVTHLSSPITDSSLNIESDWRTRRERPFMSWTGDDAKLIWAVSITTVFFPSIHEVVLLMVFINLNGISVLIYLGEAILGETVLIWVGGNYSLLVWFFLNIFVEFVTYGSTYSIYMVYGHVMSSKY